MIENKKMEEGKMKTINATAPWGQLYAEIFGEEDWSEMTEAERVAIIEADLAEAEAEREQAEREQAEADEELVRIIERDRRISAAVELATTLAKADGWEVINVHRAATGSAYILCERDDDRRDIRIADHAAPTNGGWRWTEYGGDRLGSADVNIII